MIAGFWLMVPAHRKESTGNQNLQCVFLNSGFAADFIESQHHGIEVGMCLLLPFALNLQSIILSVCLIDSNAVG